MIDRRELDRIAQKARLASAKRPDLKRVSVVMRDCGCVRCSYNLKGLRFNQPCPECGTPVCQSITPEDPDAKPWQDASLWRPRWWINIFGLPVERPKHESKDAGVVPQPRCIRCGYDCTGVPRASPCPECGTPRMGSQIAAARDSEEAVNSFVQHGGAGVALCYGWLVTLIALALTWIALSTEHSVGGTPWTAIGIVGFGACAAAAAIIAVAMHRMLVLFPPPSVAAAHRRSTLWLAALGPAAWSFACLASTAACAMGGTGRISPPLVIHSFWILLVAAIIMSVYGRVMYTIASIVGHAEEQVQASVIGWPLAVLVFTLGSWWLTLANGGQLVNFVVAIFVTMFGSVFAWGFFAGNIRLGNAISWAPRNRHHADERRLLKIEKWRARAEADRAHERKYGNSTSL